MVRKFLKFSRNSQGGEILILPSPLDDKLSPPRQHKQKFEFEKTDVQALRLTPVNSTGKIPRFPAEKSCALFGYS